MATLKDRGIILCDSCSKPLSDEYIVVRAGKVTFKYHEDYAKCASAEPLRKDWYRQSGRA